MGEPTNIHSHGPCSGIRQLLRTGRLDSRDSCRCYLFREPIGPNSHGIPVFDLMDDVAVIAFVAKTNLTAISNFRKWEIRVGA